MWMNEYDVENAVRRYGRHPVAGPAARTLASLVAGTNRCSDGWPYWKLPGRAAEQLQTLLTEHDKWARSEYRSPREGGEADAATLRKAYAQLRRFRTAKPQCVFRIEAAPGVPGDPEPEAPAAPEQHTVRITVTGDRAVVEVTGGGPLPPGRYLGAVVKLSDRRAEVKASGIC